MNNLPDVWGANGGVILKVENDLMMKHKCVVRACPNTGRILIHKDLPLSEEDLKTIQNRLPHSHIVV